jgi:Nucleotide modification associated domain 1
VEHSLRQYDAVIARCKAVFLRKNKDYGTAWRVLRLSSLTDQIYIKASRIRNIEEQGVTKVNEGVEVEYEGIINYCLMAIIQHELEGDMRQEIPVEEISGRYDQAVLSTRVLFENKNHDYGEIWRDMRISSYTDLILMKILRIKQIEDNQGLLLASEGVEANYMDIINYSIFALIRITEETT